jgi:hypothetical protein
MNKLNSNSIPLLFIFLKKVVWPGLSENAEDTLPSLGLPALRDIDYVRFYGPKD